MDWKCALFSCMRGGLHDDCKRSHVERKVQRVILILSATLVAFLGAGGVSGAAEIHGRVVRIADGDTLTLVTGGSRTPARASASRTAFGRGIPVASATAPDFTKCDGTPPSPTNRQCAFARLSSASEQGRIFRWFWNYLPSFWTPVRKPLSRRCTPMPFLRVHLSGP